MRLAIIILILCALGLVGAYPAHADAPKRNLFDLDKPMELNAGSSKRMFVTFNHSSHKQVACRTCHHEGLPGKRYAPCTNSQCHVIQGARSRDALSVYMAYHAPDMERSCLGCHRKLAKAEPERYPAFKGCRPCHVNPSEKQAQQTSAK